MPISPAKARDIFRSSRARRLRETCDAIDSELGLGLFEFTASGIGDDLYPDVVSLYAKAGWLVTRVGSVGKVVFTPAERFDFFA